MNPLYKTFPQRPKTKQEFGHYLKTQVRNKEDVIQIADCCLQFSQFFSREEDADYDAEYDDILYRLALMDAAPEFEFTYEKLEKIADDLIAGKKVVL